MSPYPDMNTLALGARFTGRVVDLRMRGDSKATCTTRPHLLVDMLESGIFMGFDGSIDIVL